MHQSDSPNREGPEGLFEGAGNGMSRWRLLTGQQVSCTLILGTPSDTSIAHIVVDQRLLVFSSN
jgi:hypothetical protein